MPFETAPSGTPLRCSVVIPTWKRAATLRETLSTVLTQSYELFEIHIVSDGEDDAIHALSEEFAAFPSLHWHFLPENRGQAAARNAGARAASGDILLFLDDDTHTTPDWIALHMRRHQTADPRIPLAVVGRIAELRVEPSARVTDRALQRGWESTLENYERLFLLAGPDSIGDEFENAIAFGMNCSIRRDLFLRHGGYLEALRVTDEDMELGLRLYLAGVESVFEPRAVVTHHSAKDLTAYFRRCWQASGATDVYRVFELGQHNSQTRRLLSISHGARPTQLLRRVFWRGARTLRSLAGQLEGMANRTGSRLLASAWGRLCPQALYWSSVRSTGCTLSQLKGLAAPAKCALMLHSLSMPQSPEESTYYLAPDHFRLLMRRFCRTGYRTVTTAQWLRDEVPRKHVLLTFDDGYDDLYTELFPWLQEHGFTAVIFLVADRIGETNLWDQASGSRPRQLLTLTQIREMQQCGVEFGSHTLTHPWLPSLSDVDLERELRDSKSRLENLLGVEVNSFAYPFGGVDRRVRAAVARAGYRLGFTTLPGTNRWNDPLCQNRADIPGWTTPLEFKFHLRYGMGYRQLGASFLRSAEGNAPTTTLRKLAGGLRRWGGKALDMRSGRKRRGEWPSSLNRD
ncbi:MAG TPA: polysaccharide deacetylase family protein [Terracidiphilus sp.]|nr:polysaccharide deacetylase family protein [Terracidiphilus sp.]